GGDEECGPGRGVARPAEEERQADLNSPGAEPQGRRGIVETYAAGDAGDVGPGGGPRRPGDRHARRRPGDLLRGRKVTHARRGGIATDGCKIRRLRLRLVAL